MKILENNSTQTVVEKLINFSRKYYDLENRRMSVVSELMSEVVNMNDLSGDDFDKAASSISSIIDQLTEINEHCDDLFYFIGIQSASISRTSAKTENKDSFEKLSDTFKFGNTAYHITFEGDKVTVNSIHPYDDADYHYAVSNTGGESFEIYLDGKFVEAYFMKTFEEDEEDSIKRFGWTEIARELGRLDKKVEPRMMHN